MIPYVYMNSHYILINHYICTECPVILATTPVQSFIIFFLYFTLCLFLFYR